MAYNPNGRPPVDWSYDSIMDGPNYLSFEGGQGGYPNRGRGGPSQYPRGNRPPWQQQGYGRGGPPPPYYGGRGGGGPGYHPYRPPPPPVPLGEYYRPEKTYHPAPHHYPPRGRRGFYDRGDRGFRGGRFQRSRGGRRPAYTPTGNEPITAFFHPSMLEDPWNPPVATKPTETAAEKAMIDEAAKVKIEDNDPELLQIVEEMKEQQASSTEMADTDGKQEPDPVTENTDESTVTPDETAETKEEMKVEDGQ